MDAEEMLLAAIDLRLQQLLQLRDQRQAAAAQRAARTAPPAPPATPAAAPALPVWYDASGASTPAAPANTAGVSFDWPGPEVMQQQACQLAATQGVNDAVLSAASKLQQLQAVQRMQLALQRELFELLAYGC